MFDGLHDDLEEFRRPAKKKTELDEELDDDDDFVPSFKKPLAERLVEKFSK